MIPLSPIPLPLLVPPPGYSWEGRDISALSTSTAFNTGIDARDSFLGRRRCIVCGVRGHLEHCHIIWDSEQEVWVDLKARRWIPQEAKGAPRHEPRDGILMCKNHHAAFDSYTFFIRYFPAIRKFVLVNYSDHPDLEEYHGKAIALDMTHRYAPFPSLFIIHEMRVRGFHPFSPTQPTVPNEIAWQNWISSDGVFDNATGSFIRDASNVPPLQQQPQLQLTAMNAGGPSSGGGTLALNADVIADILAATHAMPSWKACQVEGTSWTGTAEENIQKYVSSIGVEDR